ncbi:MAG: hypothetical protein QOD29_5314, partial [Alphaproteobacteria bacterium]|nr:hypothetical protein [Alphaproteobacteria bacterium]
LTRARYLLLAHRVSAESSRQSAAGAETDRGLRRGNRLRRELQAQRPGNAGAVFGIGLGPATSRRHFWGRMRE